MIQQVNLCPTTSNDGELAINPYLLLVAAMGVALLLISLNAWHNLSAQQSQQQALQLQLQQASANLLLLQAQMPNPEGTTQLTQQLQQSQTTLASLSHIIELLADDQSDQAMGFSRYLDALATHADHQAWLSRIYLNATTHEIKLEGSSFKAEAIPALLQGLQQSDAFKSRRFAHLSIQQAKDKPEQINFSIRSNHEEDLDHANRP